MGKLTLHKFTANDFTLVQNHFIDTYMPSANGEFVKIYLYLLRCSSADMELSLSSIADAFNHTENDVKRALSYWEKLHLLRLTYDHQGLLTDIAFTNGEPSSDGQLKRLEQYTRQMDSGTLPMSEEPPDTPAPYSPSSPPGRFAVSPERKKELAQQEEVRQLLYIAEQYLGKTLSSTEVNHILFFYDQLHFSSDLIEYLVEYCVSKGKRNISYIRKVALEWSARSISTVREAKADTNLYHKDYYTILNAFGIQGRGPAQAEIELMARWIYQMGFSTEVILEACKRTINRTHTPNFQYTDKILDGWKKLGVHHVEDIAKLDSKPVPSADSEPSSGSRGKTSSNKFNNFPQRKYDYDKLEEQILDC